MRLEFLGTYKGHEIKKTKNDKDYVVLTCAQELSKNDVKIFVFDNDLFENLEMFKPGDNIAVIYETWFNRKTKQQVLIIKDIVVS